MVLEFLVQFGSFVDFRSIILQWQAIGLFDIILPFLLVFAVVYAVLERSKLLGSNKGVYAVIAIAIAFFSISNPYTNQIFQVLFSNASIGLLFVLVFMVFLAFFVIDPAKEQWWRVVGGIFASIVFIWLLSRTFAYTGYEYDIFAWLSQSPGIAMGLYVGLPLGIILWLITRSGEDERGRDIAVVRQGGRTQN